MLLFKSLQLLPSLFLTGHRGQGSIVIQKVKSKKKNTCVFDLKKKRNTGLQVSEHSCFQLHDSVGWTQIKKVIVYLVVRVEQKPVLLLMGICQKVAVVASYCCSHSRGASIVSTRNSAFFKLKSYVLRCDSCTWFPSARTSLRAECTTW